MTISAFIWRALALTIACLAERNLFRGWWNTCEMKRTCARVNWCENIFCKSILHKMKLFISMLNRTIWIRSMHSTRAILQSFDIYIKANINWSLLNNDVHAEETVVSEMDRLLVKVKGIQHVRVFESYSKLCFSPNVKVIKGRSYF